MSAIASPSNYMIGFVPRSGSTWLCQMLASTNKLGIPREYFHPNQLEEAAKAFTTTKAFAEWLLTYQSRGGVFGFKATWTHLQALVFEGERPADIFGCPLACIWVDREDREAQAISEYKAMTTGRFHSSTPDSGVVVPFDVAHIREVIAALEHDRITFLDWFDRAGIVPLKLTYEQLCADPAGCVATIAATLKVDINGCELSAKNEKLSGLDDVTWKLALERV